MRPIPSPLLVSSFSVILATLVVAMPSVGADWPGWRGADRTDHSPDTGLMKKWPSGGPERLWIFKDAGAGYSGPAVVGGKLFTMGIRDEIEEVVMCLDAASGSEIWSTTIGTRYKNGWGDGPRGTPTFSEGRLYCLGAKGDLACLDARYGKKLWSKNLKKDFSGKVPGWGYTESPLVVDGTVFATPGGKKGAVVALDAKSGRKRWQSRDFTDGAHYASCISIESGGKRQVVQLTKDHVVGLDFKSGDVLWKSEWPGQTAVIPTPIFHGGHVYITSGYGVGCKLIKLPEGGRDAATDVYRNEIMVNHHGGVVLVDGKLYGHSDNGGWTCQDFRSGEPDWQEKGFGKGAIHYADGMLYCLEEKSGNVALIEATPEGWKEKSRFKLDPQTEIRADRGRIWTHPVVVGGKLYLRDQDLIYCYDVKGQ